MFNPRPIRWLWLIVGIVAIVCAGCDSPPPTDETDPLPTVFDNKPLDPSKYGGAAGMGIGRSRRMRGLGTLEADVLEGIPHEHGAGSGSSGSEQKATTNKTPQKKSDEPPATESDKPDKSQGTDPKKDAEPATAPTDSSKQEKKEDSNKEQP